MHFLLLLSWNFSLADGWVRSVQAGARSAWDLLVSSVGGSHVCVWEGIRSSESELRA